MENNPYSTPEGELLSEEEGYGEIKFLSPGIRIGRMRYLSHIMLLSLACYILVIPGMVLFASGSTTLGVVLLIPAYIGLIIVTIIPAIQRFHDLNRSGWFCLLFIVPVVNLGAGIYLVFWPGTEGSNEYGKHPPPNKLWNWIVGLLLPIISIVGILAAVAIPAYQDYTVRAQESAYEGSME